MDDEPDGRAGPDRDRGLNPEIALRDLVARTRDIVLHRHPDRLNEIALPGERELGTHAEQSGQRDRLKRVGSSIAVTKVSAVTGPTPGMSRKRRQSSSRATM